MKTTFILLFAVLLTGQVANAQHTLSATVQSLNDQSPVVYANVGIVGANIGTVTNPDGFFTLTCADSLLDFPLRISLYGFEPYVLSVREAVRLSEAGGWTIHMAEHVQEQEEVLVRAPELKEKELGRRSDNGFMTIGFVSDQLGSEMGSAIQIKKKTYVQDFNFFIYTVGYDSLVFRINFYACDEKGVPSDSLVTESVLFGWSSAQQGVVKIDLKERYILLHQDVLMSLEIVDGVVSSEAPDKLVVQFGGKMVGGTFARQTSQSKWEEVPMITPAFYINVLQEK